MKVPRRTGYTADFVVAVWDGTKYIEVSDPHYITNPEAVAPNTAAFNDPLTKKGA